MVNRSTFEIFVLNYCLLKKFGFLNMLLNIGSGSKEKEYVVKTTV